MMGGSYIDGTGKYGVDPRTGQPFAYSSTGTLGVGYGGPESGDINPWDVTGYEKNGAADYRDGMNPGDRLGMKAQLGLYSQDAWAKGVEGRDALSMRAAQLDPYTAMSAANAGAGAMAGPTTIDQTYSNADRGYQTGLMDQLQTQAQGGGPSLATAMLKSGTDQGLAAQLAAAASQRGVSQEGLAGRNVAMMGAQGQGQLASQSAMARMQEQLNAQQQLGGLSSSVRGQDLGVAGQQAALDQAQGFANQNSANQFSLANAGFQQQAYGANAGAANQYGLQQGLFNQQAASANLSSGLSQRQSGDDARENAYNQTQGAWQTASGLASAAAARQQAQAEADRQNTNMWIKTIAGAAGTAIAGPAGAAAGEAVADEGISSEDNGSQSRTSSDERGKTDFRDAKSELSKFLLDLDKPDHAAAPGIARLPISSPSPRKAPATAQRFGSHSAPPSPLAGLDGRDLYGDTTYGSVGGPGRMDTPLNGADIVAGNPYYYTGGAPSIYGSGSTLSDEEEKTDFKPASGGLRDFLRDLGTRSYRYKDPDAPGAGEGRYVSANAQEIEKSPIGKSMVTEGPDGRKMVDYGKGFGTILSGIAMHERRLSEVEQDLGKKKVA